MKNLKILSTVVLCVFFLQLNSQVKVHSSGNFSIGSLSDQGKRLDVFGGINKFHYSSGSYTRQPLEFVLFAVDPRISSTNKIVFYKINGSGHLNIECKTVFEKSDSTKKQNLARIERSMEKILQLDGYNYNWVGDKNKTKHSGLLAQQIERVIPEAVSTVDSTGEKLVSYSSLIPYLVEAIKEQHNEAKNKDQKIATLENKLNLLDNKLKSYESGLRSSSAMGNLEQNNPNPFTVDTEIKYTVPGGTNAAALYVFNMQGSMIINHSIHGPGEGSFIINASQLTPGMYMYTLVLDGNEVDTKRMILTD